MTIKPKFLIITFLLANHLSAQNQNTTLTPPHNIPLGSLVCMIGKSHLEIFKSLGSPTFLKKTAFFSFYQLWMKGEMIEEKINKRNWSEFLYYNSCNKMKVKFKKGKCRKIIFAYTPRRIVSPF